MNMGPARFAILVSVLLLMRALDLSALRTETAAAAEFATILANLSIRPREPPPEQRGRRGRVDYETRARRARANNPTPSKFAATIKPEIFSANDSRLSTSMIGTMPSAT
jgi:hypothetical protein